MQVIKLVAGWMKESGIKVKVNKQGYIRDIKGNTLAVVTPKGHLDISGIGNYSPENIKDKKDRIIAGMKGLVGGGHN